MVNCCLPCIKTMKVAKVSEKCRNLVKKLPPRDYIADIAGALQQWAETFYWTTFKMFGIYTVCLSHIKMHRVQV